MTAPEGSVATAAPPPAATRATVARPARQSLLVYLPGTALSLLAVLLLGLVLQLSLLSGLRHARDQQIALADFRVTLADARAPTGQLDLEGRLHPAGTPVAVLEIPALGITEVVFSGTSANLLMSGPGHRRDSVLPGQAGVSVIMGRRAAYGGPFRYLDRLSSGDQVIVRTGQGEHGYRVLGVRHAGDLIPPPPATGAGRLVLVTAAGQPFMPQDVLRVDLDQITPVQPGSARPLTRNALPPAELELAAEPEAWVPLVLWGQLLFITSFALVWSRARWGRAQAWVVGVPVLAAVGIAVADQIGRLLPNLT